MSDPEKLTADWVESWEKLLAQNLPFKVFLKGRDLTYLACNENYALDHGLKTSEILGRSDYDLYPRELAEKYRAEDLRILETGRSETIEGRYVKDGQEHHGQTIKSLFRDSSGEVIGILGTYWDITELVHVKEALRESEERYAQINNSTLDYVVSYDSTGRITNANRAFCEAMGLSPDQVIGKNHADLGFPEDKCLEWAETIREAIETDEPVTTYTSTTQKDGSVRYFEVSLNSIHNFQGDRIGVNLISRNITERKRAEEALQQSEEKYRALVENANEAIIVTQDGVLKFANPRVNKLLGYSLQEVVGRPFIELIHPDDRLQVAQRYQKRLEGEVPTVVYPFRTIHKDGSIRWAEINSVLIAWEGKPAVMSYLSDITERKRAEEALRESERKLKIIFDLLPMGVAVLDNGRKIVYENPALGKIIQMDREDLHREKYKTRTYTHPDGTPMSADEFASMRATREQKAIHNVETGIVLEDGKLIWTDVSAVPVALPDWKMVILTVDITERRQAEEALRESKERLELALIGGNLGFYDLDLQTGEGYTDERYLGMLGYAPGEIDLGCRANWEQQVHPDDLRFANHLVRSDIQGEMPVYDEEYRMRHKSGEWVWVRDRSQITARAADGRPLRMTGIHENITERKQAEEALRESEHRLADIIDFLPDATFAVNLKGEVIAWNRALEELTGTPKEELIGKGDFAYALPFYGKTGPMLIDRIFQDWKEIEKNYDYLTKREDQLIAEAFVPALRGGKGAYLWGIASPLYDSNGSIVGAIESLRDISERKWIEEELRQNHERFQLANRATFNAIWDWNLQTDALWWNENFKVLFGYPAEEIEPGIESWTNRIHPEDLDRIKVSIHSAIDSGRQFWSDQYRFRRKDGVYAEIEDRGYINREANGKPVRMIGAMQDITDRKRSEKALQESEEKHRAVVERANDGIVIVQGGTIRFSNPSLLAMTGYQTGETEGMEFSRFIPEENRAGVEDRYRKRMAGEELSSVFETALLHKSGKKIPVEMNSVVIPYEGKPADLVIMRDIAERKQIEGEMDKTRADFLFGVSHELKTPLFLMNISLEMLENSSETGRAKRTAEFLETWKRNLHRLQHLVFNMVDSQRTQTMGFKLERQSTDFRALIQRVLQEEELLAEPKKVRITLDLAPIPPLWMDPDATHRLVENLLTNAIKFSPRSGEVTIRLREEDAQAVLTVKDQGPGISAAEQEGLFLPFQRAATAVHSVIPGTGLGLYVAKIIADAHGGTISLRSKLGKGTTVTVRLPLAVPESHSSASPSAK